MFNFVRFLTYRPVSGIFAIKVESCQKSRRNLDVFWSSQILGKGLPKLYAHYHPCIATRRLEKFHEDIPTSPEVIGVHTLNFKANFKFSRLDFFLGGGTPSHLGCALSRLGQSLARVKFSGRSTRYGLKYSLPNKCILVGPNSHVIPSH